MEQALFLYYLLLFLKNDFFAKLGDLRKINDIPYIFLQLN